MAINEAILQKIDQLEITEPEKYLLKNVLSQQEHASKQYTKQYISLIHDYLEKKKND